MISDHSVLRILKLIDIRCPSRLHISINLQPHQTIDTTLDIRCPEFMLNYMEFYHLLNRGVDKRNIFLDEKDYFRFMHDLFEFNNIKNIGPNSGHFFNQYMDIGCPYTDTNSKCKTLIQTNANSITFI